jgi:hypothetical protein
MTGEQAAARLEHMVAPDIDPTLSPEQMDALLELAKREDAEGLAPTDDGWEPTFDLDAAAAEGWRWKAGMAVPRFGVSLDGDSLQRQQIYAHCLRQAEMYANRVVGSMGVKTLAPIGTEEFQVEA